MRVLIIIALTAATCASVFAFVYLQATKIPKIDTGPLSDYQRGLNGPIIVDPPMGELEL